MRRHVVGAFVRVLPLPRSRRQVIEPPLQIPKHGRIGVFLDDQTRRSMSEKERRQPRTNARPLHERTELRRDIDKPLASSTDLEMLLKNPHAGRDLPQPLAQTKTKPDSER